jgi:hypothetical protein
MVQSRKSVMIPRQCWRIHCSRPARNNVWFGNDRCLVAGVRVITHRLCSFAKFWISQSWCGKIGVDGGDFSSDACQHAGRQAGVWTGGRLTMQKPKLPRYGKTEESPDWRVESPVWRAEKRSAEE